MDAAEETWGQLQQGWNLAGKDKDSGKALTWFFVLKGLT